MVTYNRVDFEPIVRDYAAMNRGHHGLAIVHPVRFPSSEFARLSDALVRLLDRPELGGSFLVWVQEGRDRPGGRS